MPFETFPSTNMSSQMVAQAAEGDAGKQKTEEAPKHGGVFGDLFADRKEHTLAGCAIGSVRDVFSGNLTEEQKAKRAEGNDFVATIAADTAAMMSKRVAVGGLVRATMLADTKGDARDFALGFVKDGLEGVGLNYIGKMQQPGSRAYEFAGSRLGVGLKQEVSVNAASGAMFGALKAGADPTAWRDKDGHFSFQSGLNNLSDWKKMSAATLSGAVINVPAGMLGTRIARSSTINLANRTGSEAIGTLAGGVLSGGGSGAVFGGLDAVVHGKSFLEVGKSTFDGMLIGAGTGGVMSGFHVFRPGGKPQAGDGMASESRRGGQQAAESQIIGQKPVEKLAATPAIDSELPAISDASRIKLSKTFEYILPEEVQARMFAAHDSVAYAPEAKLGVMELNQRLSLLPSREIAMTRIKEGVTLPEKFADWKDFIQYTETKNEPTRVYRVQGSQTQIIVPEAYAKKLDQVRNLRLWAEIDAPSYDNLSGVERRIVQKHITEGKRELIDKIFGDKADNIVKIVNARMKLNGDPAFRRALPEDFIQAIQALPNPGMVKELVLLDEPYYRDNYKTAKAEEGKVMPTAAYATEDGRITFFEADNTLAKGSTSTSQIHEFLSHEWAHLVKFKFAELSGLFNEASEIETGFYAREYAKRQYPDNPELKHHENFAVHMGEELMSPDADRFFTTAHSAPIRTSLMARAWLESIMGGKQKTSVHPSDFAGRINQIPEGVANRDTQIARLKYIAEHIEPLARERLLDQVAAGNMNDRLRAAFILGRIGQPADMTFAENILNSTGDPQLRKALFNSITNISDPHLDNRLNFLIDNAAVGKPLRNEALSALSGFQHPEARSYYDALRLAGDPRNLPELMNLIDRMPVTGAKIMAFESVVQLAKSSPFAEDFMQSFLLKTLQKHPDIRIEALKEAVKHPSAALEAEAVRLQRYSDKHVSDRAKQVAAEIRLGLSVEQYKRWIHGSDEQYKYRAIQELGWLNDRRAIPVLLEVIEAGQPTWNAAAAEALQHYSPNMIAVVAHQMQRHGSPVRWADVQRLMTQRRS